MKVIKQNEKELLITHGLGWPQLFYLLMGLFIIGSLSYFFYSFFYPHTKLVIDCNRNEQMPLKCTASEAGYADEASYVFDSAQVIREQEEDDEDVLFYLFYLETDDKTFHLSNLNTYDERIANDYEKRLRGFFEQGKETRFYYEFDERFFKVMFILGGLLLGVSTLILFSVLPRKSYFIFNKDQQLFLNIDKGLGSKQQQEIPLGTIEQVGIETYQPDGPMRYEVFLSLNNQQDNIILFSDIRKNQTHVIAYQIQEFLGIDFEVIDGGNRY